MFTIMDYFSEQARERDLPFRSDSDELNNLAEQRAALTCLADAVSRCQYEDMRTPQVLAALRYLAQSLPAQSHALPALQHFRQALALLDPRQRTQILQHSYRSIELAAEG